MPEPVITPTAPPVIATTTPTNGSAVTEPFGNQMEEMLAKAFAEARPEQFKSPTTSVAAAREAPQLTDTNSDEHVDRSPQEAKAEKPAAAPEVKTTPKAAQWKEVNEERERLRKENEQFKAEREKWQKSQVDRTEYDNIKKHNDELLSRIQAIAVEKDPRFENYFKQKTDTAIALAKQAVGEVHGERVGKLLQLPDSDWRTNQLEEVMSELGPTRQSRLGAAIVEMDRVHLERNTALSKSKENWESMQAADRNEKQAQAQAFERSFQDTLEKWSDPEKGLVLFQKKDGDETHNAEVQQRVETARNILNLKLDAPQLAKAALWSAAAPGLLKTLMATSEELKAVKAENEALKSGGPDLKTGQEEAAIDEEKQYEGMSYGEIIAAKAQKAGGWQ